MSPRTSRIGLNLLKWSVTLGREPQNFLGAKWIPRVLARIPGRHQRIWALRLLSFSPHYFLQPNAPRYAGMTSKEYLEAAFAATAESRIPIYDAILRPHLDRSMAVLDYGCGPGFLARVVSPHVARIHACDISRGALACAGILNCCSNVEYLSILDGGLDEVPDRGVDAVYSFAVVQHLTDAALDTVLANCAAKLKRGGRLLLHVQLGDEVWRTETEWNMDRSLAGRVKYRCGLHCFARSEGQYSDTVAKHGFVNIRIERLTALVANADREQHSQAFLTARLSA